MNELGKITLIFISVALCSSCNFSRKKQQHSDDSILTAQSTEKTNPKPSPQDGNIFLGKYSKGQVLNSLYHRKDSVFEWINSDIREWKPIDSSILVLNEIELARKENRFALEICLVKEIEGDLKLIARGEIERESDDEEDYYLINTQLDTNTYKISEQEYALGITGTPTWVNNGFNYYNLGTNLILLSIVKNKIYPIVLLPLEYTHGDRHQENDSTIVTDNEDSSSSQITLLESKTNNYFDILLKTKSINTSDKKETPTITLRNTKYQWNKGRYVKTEEN